MLAAVIAFVGALVAVVGAGALMGGFVEERSGWLFAWIVAMVGLTLALAAQAFGHGLGFGPSTFRMIELGSALLPPVWVAIGLVDLLAYQASTRFTWRLLATSYTIVAAVIVLADPIRGAFDKALPVPGRHWDWLPEIVLGAGHVFSALVIGGALIVAAVRVRDGDEYDMDNLHATVVVGLSGFACLAVIRLKGTLPDAVVPVVLTIVAAALWYAVARPLAPYEDDFADDEGQTAPREQSVPAPRYGEPAAYEKPEYERASEPTYQPARQPISGPPIDAAYEPSLEPAYPPPPAEPTYQPPSQSTYAGSTPAGTDPPSAGAGSDPLAATAQPNGQAQPALKVYGLITVFTLMDGALDKFDKLAAEVVEDVRAGEPDTLIYTCHTVPSAPLQRIFYELYRDELAYREHLRQPHMLRFIADRQSYVLATNVIELKLKAAKVVPLPTPFTSRHGK